MALQAKGAFDVRTSPLHCTSDIAGLAGTLDITVADKQYYYDFFYTLP